METTFFDLPFDLREIIYRRSRFLETRRRVAELLGPVTRPLWKRDSAIIEIVLTVSPTKRMIVRRCVYEKDGNRPGAVFDSVEVVDEGSVHVVLKVPEGTDKITLLLGTQRMDTAHVYEKGEGHSFWLSTYWWRHNHETNMPVLMPSPVYQYVA